MRIRVLPYKQGSRSAKALADALGGKVLKLVGSKYIGRMGDIVINWGNTNPPANFATANGDFDMEGFYNDPNYIRRASNKLDFFELMTDNGLQDIIPEYWTNKEEIPDDNKLYPIFCRTILNGHSGAGIVPAASRDGLVDCKLYVRYVKKQDEYRIHLGKLPNGETSIINQQRKAKRADAEDVNWQIRNHHNGFVFVRQDVNPPACVVEAAKRCFEATGLDFGAVDVIYNAKQERAYVLEINTAPGMENTTVTDYANFFKEFL
jgi:hypothetical protein